VTIWDWLWYAMLILYVPACIGLIVIVLLQKGKGTSFAGAFGVGPGSEAVFGPRSTKSIAVRITEWAAGVFMVLALLMSIVMGRVGTGAAPETVAPEEAQTDAALELLQDQGLGTAITSEEDRTDEESPGAATANDEDTAAEEPLESTSGDGEQPTGEAPTMDEATPAEDLGADTEDAPAASAADTQEAPPAADE